MSFKIVQTIEKRERKLTVVPSYWENNGLLRIPKIGASKLVTNEHSKPLQGWTAMKCTVKRSAIPTYQEAEQELAMMEGKSDTDVSEHEERSIVQLVTNYNAMAEQLNHRREKQEIPGCSTSTHDFQLPNDYQIIYNGGDIVTTEPSNINTESQNIHIETASVNFDELLDNQKKILENQKIILQTMQELQKFILEKEEKNSRQISNLTVLIDDCFTRLNRQIVPTTVSLGEASGFEKEKFIIKPLNSVKELEELECLLSDKAEKLKFEKRFEFLCSKTSGNGVTCAYKLLDILFSREFLCKCSWSGGSRGTDTKVALKGFKNVLNFFYGMIHLWDATYTVENNEKFFKIVTKNATKRLEIKDLRTSSKRKRQEKTTSKKRKTETSHGGNAKNHALIDENVTVAAQNGAPGPSSDVVAMAVQNERQISEPSLDVLDEDEELMESLL